MKIFFTVHGAPVAQPRTKARAVVTNGRAFAHVYEPGGKASPVRQWKSDIKTAAVQKQIKHPTWSVWDGPVSLTVEFYLPRPKTLCRKKDYDGWIPAPKKPDIENLLKALMDALTGVIYHDDRQITTVRATKGYHAKADHPKTIVELEQL